MMNDKISASKHFNRTEKKQLQNPRSPLKVKDFNISSSSCSSSFSSSTTATSISSEAPKGCLSFLLPHHSSNVSKNSSDKKPKSFAANSTPKSAQNFKRLRGKLSGNGRNLVKACNNLQNPGKLTSKNVHRLKKNPPNPCLYPWKSGKNPSSRSDHNSKLSVVSDNKLYENAANFTPLNKIGYGSALHNADRYAKSVKLDENNLDSSDTSSPIPPVQASVSPEIQGGSMSVIKATPNTCYAAGHVLSGVSDKRKSRPRGILTIGDNDLFGSNKSKVFSSEDEDVIKPRVSLVPSPVEASMHWSLSPCDERSEDKDDDHGESGVRLNEYELAKLFGCSSSPASSLGFSSELCNKSNSSVTTSEATTVSYSSRSRSSDFRGLLGPSFDHLVISPWQSSPLYGESSKIAVSPKQDRHHHGRETTPCSEISIGSGNVIQTPQSNSSSKGFELSHLSRDEISRLWFETELNSVAEVLRRVSLSPDCEIPMVDSCRTSLEFDPLIRPDCSTDLSIFRKAVDHQTSPGVPESLLCSFPDSEVRISWKEGLANRIFEMDELDCCRCFSDEEDDTNGCSDPCQSSSCLDVDISKTADNAYKSGSLADNKDDIIREDAERFPTEETSLCPELSNGDGGSSGVTDNFSWKVCYENHLFRV